eukprot:1549363-Pyramimonas_sp.AAC.1
MWATLSARRVCWVATTPTEAEDGQSARGHLQSCHFRATRLSFIIPERCPIRTAMGTWLSRRCRNLHS